jgi:Spy/CpxP family protein refolding chaperone
MKSIRSRFLIAAIAVLFTTVVSNSHSQTAEAAPPPMHGHGLGMGEHMLDFFADYLSLSDAQQAQAKAILQKEQATLKPLFDQLHQTHQQLRQYEQGAYDEAKVRALVAQESQAQVELTVQKTRIHSELFQLLTPDQQAKMKEFEANRDARRAKHMKDASAPPQE